jgi:hypothetical protein
MWLGSYLSMRIQKIRIGDAVSKDIKVTSGVPHCGTPDVESTGKSFGTTLLYLVFLCFPVIFLCFYSLFFSYLLCIKVIAGGDRDERTHGWALKNLLVVDLKINLALKPPTVKRISKSLHIPNSSSLLIKWPRPAEQNIRFWQVRTTTDLALKLQVVKSISKITPRPHQLSFPPYKVA